MPRLFHAINKDTTPRPIFKKAATKVFGATKAVGKAALKPVKWMGKQIEKEWRGEDANIEDFRKKQKKSGWTN